MGRKCLWKGEKKEKREIVYMLEDDMYAKEKKKSDDDR